MAIFQALKRSGVSYVTSIYTFGDFSSDAQRIRLPQETLTLDTANCVDVSVAFASGMDPAEAHAAAQRQFGNFTRVAEESRELFSFRLTDQFRRDVCAGPQPQPACDHRRLQQVAGHRAQQ